MATAFDNPLMMLRQLKGAPLSVFLACQIVRQVVSQRFLVEQTGYSDYAVTRALSYLTEHNFVARVTGGWMIATAVQLPLMPVLPDGEGDAVEIIQPENREKRDFQKRRKTPEVQKDPNVEACKAILQAAGIFGKRADEIAEAPHVTPEYIRAHLVQVESETWDNPLGMAIYRMTQGVPAPQLQENGHVVGCKCGPCAARDARRKYAWANDDEEDEDGDQP